MDDNRLKQYLIWVAMGVGAILAMVVIIKALF